MPGFEKKSLSACMLSLIHCVAFSHLRSSEVERTLPDSPCGRSWVEAWMKDAGFELTPWMFGSHAGFGWAGCSVLGLRFRPSNGPDAVDSLSKQGVQNRFPF